MFISSELHSPLHKYINITVIAIASFILWGCNNKHNANKASPHSNRKVVRIAAIYPLSGPNAAVGRGMLNSLKLAIDQANDSKTFSSTKIEIVSYDDASKPEQGVAAATKACSDPLVIAVSAHWNSGVALATRDVFHSCGLLNILAGTVASQITGDINHPEINRITTNDVVLNRYAARFVSHELKIANVFLLDDGSVFGKSQSDLLITFAAKEGINVLGRDSITVGEYDFSGVLEKISHSGADLIFYGGVTTEAALLVRQIKRMGLRTRFANSAGILTDAFLAAAGPDAEGVLCANVLLPLERLPGGKDFLQAYTKAGFKDSHEIQGIFAYAAGQIILSAISRYGFDRKALVDNIRNDAYETALGSVKFDNYGNNIYPMITFFKVINGRWVLTHIVDNDGLIRKVDDLKK